MSCCRISGSLSFNSRLTSAADPLGSPGAYASANFSRFQVESRIGVATRRFKIHDKDCSMCAELTANGLRVRLNFAGIWSRRARLCQQIGQHQVVWHGNYVCGLILRGPEITCSSSTKRCARPNNPNNFLGVICSRACSG
jgi:hypothetical protein